MSTTEPRCSAHKELNVVRDVAVDLYREVFAHESDDPFFSLRRFIQRIERHAGMVGFEAVVAHACGEVAGFAYGITLPDTTRWWATVHPPLDDSSFTHEDGHRTYALFEVIVKPGYQGHGIGRRLHDELLAQRGEERVTVATRRGNTRARAAYTSWGYRHVGTRQPASSGPLLDVFVRARILPAGLTSHRVHRWRDGR